MARRTSRRRQRVLWYPTWGSGSVLPGGATGPRFAPTRGLITNNGQTTVGVQIPLTYDLPPESEIAAGTAPSLADFELTAWRLKRFVGKLHLRAVRSERTIAPDLIQEPVVVVASLIVRRVDAAGAALANFNFNTVNNILAENARDPFVWRRSWVLSGAEESFETPTGTITGSRYPGVNSYYGSVMDGPHIDTKSARLISAEERLFFEITTSPHEWATDPADYDSDVEYMLDYRMVGVPAKSTNRRNASR